jgi:hypothetical protein
MSMGGGTEQADEDKRGKAKVSKFSCSVEHFAGRPAANFFTGEINARNEPNFLFFI